MKINRPHNVSRPEVDRGADARKTSRADEARRRAGNDVSVGAEDRIETDVSTFIDETVGRTKAELASRLEDVRARRDELLARADDDDAIQAAARRLLDSL
ncbi:MAG: hypothetical protein ACF8XB_20460 [Planctomycetota bacterium JB042]